MTTQLWRQVLRIPVTDGEMCPETRERQRDRPPDALGPAGDQCEFAFKCHSRLLSWRYTNAPLIYRQGGTFSVLKGLYEVAATFS